MNRWSHGEARAPAGACQATCVMSLVVVLGGGCQLVENEFVDPIPPHQQITTPSVEGARAAAVTPEVRHRPFAACERSPADGSVTHSPLYFEDAPDTASADDGTFAWTGKDWIEILLWGRRFLDNLTFFPISAVVDPPWTVMVSDGEPSRTLLGVQYDAQREAQATRSADQPEPGSGHGESQDAMNHEASTRG